MNVPKNTYAVNLLLTLSVCIIFICVGSLFVVNDWSSTPIYLMLFVIMLCITILSYVYTNRFSSTSWFRPSYILLFALIVVNFQTNLDVLLNLGTLEDYLRDVSYDKYFGKTFILSVISVLSFVIGNTLIKLRQRHYNETRNDNNYMVFWLLCLLASFILFLVSIDISSFISGAIYQGSGAYDRSADESARWEMLLDVFITIVLSIHTYRLSRSQKNYSFLTYVRSFPIVFIGIVILYLILRLLSGDRGPVIYTILLFLFSYTYVTKVKVSFGKVLLALLSTALIMTFLNIFRMQDSSMNFKEKIGSAINYMKYEHGISTISPYTYELAQSVLCNYIAIADLEQGETELQYGKYNIYELIGTVPGSSTIMYRLFNIDISKETTAEYVTKSYLGPYYPYGLGTTALVDFYMDLGTFGVIIGFLLLGLIFQIVDNVILMNRNVSFIFLLFVLKIASMAVYIPRSSLAFVLSRVGYTLIIYVAMNWIFRSMMRK